MNTQTHKLNSRTLLLMPMMVLALSLPLTGCGKADAKQAEAIAEQEQAQARIPVATQAVTLSTITSSFTTTATLEAVAETDIVSKANGIVDQVFVEEGEYVEAGQLLAKLRDEEYQIHLAQAKAELSSIQQELRRVKDMADRNMISADAFDKLRFQAELQQARYDMAALNLAETEIRAPISGFIAQRYVKTGHLIKQYESKRLFHIVALDELQGNVHLPERELRHIKVGQTAQLAVSALPNRVIQATVARISPVIDTQSGTFKVILKIDNSDLALKAGMFAHVDLNYATRDNTVTVPRYALQSLDSQHSVFTVDDEGVAHKVDVTLGFEDETHVEILNGLQAGQEIVVSGQANLKDLATVEVIQREQKS